MTVDFGDGILIAVRANGCGKTDKTKNIEGGKSMNQDELERQMRAELAPVEAKYWAAIDEAHLSLEGPEGSYEDYRRAWIEKVVPARKLRNNIFRKYRRRLAKLEKQLRACPQF
jgi:hypothetical protein